jgi:hypothetical protein
MMLLVPVLGRMGALAGQPPKQVQPAELARIRQRAAAMGTVLLVKVQSAGKLDEDKARPQLPDEHPGMWGGGNRIPLCQRVNCSVEEVLLGNTKEREVSIVFRHADINETYNRLRTKAGQNDAVFSDDELLTEASAKPGEVYLVIVAADRNQAPDEGKAGPVYSTVDRPMQEAPPEVVKELRDLAVRIEAWRTPPEPTQEQLTAAARLVVLLASPECAKREQAQTDLLALGPAILKTVQEISEKNSDVEIRLRCAAVYEGLKPIPGGTPDDWAGGYVIEKLDAPRDEEDGDPAPPVPAVVQENGLGR